MQPGRACEADLKLKWPFRLDGLESAIRLVEQSDSDDGGRHTPNRKHDRSRAMTTTGKDDENTKTLAWLKILGIVATIAASSIGSYKAARSNAKSEASASYATMKDAVERLEQNQKMMWDMMLSLNIRSIRSVRSADESEKPALQLPPRQPLRPLPRTFDDMVNSPNGANIANVPILKGLGS
jgi:hypothetical protein